MSDQCKCPSCGKVASIFKYICSHCGMILFPCPFCKKSQKPCFTTCADCHNPISFSDKAGDTLLRQINKTQEMMIQQMNKIEDKISLLVDRLDLYEIKK